MNKFKILHIRVTEVFHKKVEKEAKKKKKGISKYVRDLLENSWAKVKK